MTSVGQFAIRYYRWSHDQALSEAEHDFPMLSKVRNRHAFKFVEFAEALSRAGRYALCSGLVKRFHQGALEKLGITITSAERALLDTYLNLDIVNVEGKKAQLPYASEREKQLRALLDEQPKSIVDARKEVKRIVTTYLRESGRQPIIHPDDVIRLDKAVSEWNVNTSMDFGGRFGRITYWHSVNLRGEVIQKQISICSWMGIASQTVWDLYMPGDIPDVAGSMLSLISFFEDEGEQLLMNP